MAFATLEANMQNDVCKMVFATFEFESFPQLILDLHKALEKGFKVKQNVKTLKFKGDWSEL